jgi:hypothetical protein
MINKNFPAILVAITTLLTSCIGFNNGANEQVKNNNNKDSIELTTLVRQVYKWHMTKKLNDFPYKYAKPNDTIFVGIDWEAYSKNIEVFKKTNFFTNDFLSYHKTIASNIDSSMKKADLKWRNINDGIPLWNTDADDWCGCQDYPDNYWDILTLDSLQIENNFASFNWTWDKKPTSYPHNYKMTAKKIGGNWMINSIEGFKYYGNVAYYDKIMEK